MPWPIGGRERFSRRRRRRWMNSGISTSSTHEGTAKTARPSSATMWTTLQGSAPNSNAKPMSGDAKSTQSTTSMTFHSIRATPPAPYLMEEEIPVTPIAAMARMATMPPAVLMPVIAVHTAGTVAIAVAMAETVVDMEAMVEEGETVAVAVVVMEAVAVEEAAVVEVDAAVAKQ